MKNLSKALFVVAVFLPFLASSQAKLNLDYSEWDLVWGDNFDGYQTSAEVIANPTYILDGSRCGQGTIIQESQIILDAANDHLIFRAERLPVPIEDECITDMSDPNFNHYLICGGSCDQHPLSEYNYISGGLRTNIIFNDNDGNGLNDFATCTSTDYTGGYYGMYEIRCKLPAGKGVWPAFWLYNGADEFDIMEQFSDEHEFKSSFNDWPGGDSSLDDGFPADSGGPESSCQITHQFERDITDEWHMFHMVWTPGKISYFFDGVEIRTETRFDYWDCPADIIFNLHTLSGATFAQADFIIDYINLYNKKSWDITDSSTWDGDYMEKYNINQTTGFTVEQNLKAVAVGEGNSVFFRNPSDKMIYYYFDSNGNIVSHTLENIANSGPDVSWNVHGDVVVGVNNQVFYPGSRGTLQNYYYKNSTGPDGGWNHGFVGIVRDKNNKVNLDCGSIDVATIAEGGNRLFYRGQDNKMHYFFYDSSHPDAQYNEWVHINLHDEVAAGLPVQLPGGLGTNALVSGNVTAADGNKVFYRGADGRIQSFGFDGSSWNHDVVDWNSGSEFLLSSACGSMDAVKIDGTQHIFYRGLNDNQMHHFFWDPTHPNAWGNDWVHEYLPFDNYKQEVLGRIVAGRDGNIFYAGYDYLLQMYRYYKGDWYHNWVIDAETNQVNISNLSSLGYSYFAPFDIGTSWDNDAIFSSNPLNNTYVEYLTLDHTDGELIDLPCFTADSYRLETHPDNNGVEQSRFSSLNNKEFENIDVENIRVFPNPASRKVTVKSFGSKTLLGSLKIINALGEVRLSQEVNQVSSIVLDIENLPPGLYYLHFSSDSEENVWTQKLIVQ